MKDPNLHKFLEIHQREIKRGFVGKVLGFAKDYLFQINDYPEKALSEFQEFETRVLELSKKA